MVLPIAERRNHRRAKVAAVAIVWSDEHGPLRYLVEDLSAGGARLSGGPALTVGYELRLSLHVAGEHLLDLRALVVRHAADGEIAIAFRDMKSGAEDIIQQVALGALEAHLRGECPSRLVLVVDESDVVCKALQRDLAALGHRVVCAWTSEQAGARLHDPYVRFDIAIIDLSVGPTDGIELLRKASGLHPGVHRVLMSGRVHPLQLAQIMGKADVILPKPWTRRALLAAMPI